MPGFGFVLNSQSDGWPLHLNIADGVPAGSGYRAMEPWEFAPPAPKPVYATSHDVEGSVAASEAHYENREITGKLRVYGTSALNLEAKLADLTQMIAQINREGGSLEVTTPSANRCYFDLLPETTGGVQFNNRYIASNRAEVELKMVARPFWRQAHPLATNVLYNPVMNGWTGGAGAMVPNNGWSMYDNGGGTGKLWNQVVNGFSAGVDSWRFQITTTSTNHGFQVALPGPTAVPAPVGAVFMHVFYWKGNVAPGFASNGGTVEKLVDPAPSGAIFQQHIWRITFPTGGAQGGAGSLLDSFYVSAAVNGADVQTAAWSIYRGHYSVSDVIGVNGAATGSRWTGPTHNSPSERYWAGAGASETSQPALDFNAPTGQPGDVPALGLLEVIDLSGNDQWQVDVGWQSRYYSAAPTAASRYEAETFTVAGTSTKVAGASGASGGGSNVVRNTDLTTSYQAILRSEIDSSNLALTHKGSFRVKARIFRPTGNTGAVTVALEWGEGDYLRRTVNDPVAYGVDDREGVFTWADLGLVHITPNATQWEFRPLAKSTVSGDEIDFDYFVLFPTGD